MAHILPTGRNFYSVDPRSLPSQAAWRVGRQLAQEVLQRYLKETGRYPESVSISVWGTSAMRTHGDDAAEILALLGVRPVWQPENRRLTGVEVVPLAELGRPRIDVTTRISGFFRDAFPQLIQLIDQAVNAVIALDEPPDQNFVRKHYLAEAGGESVCQRGPGAGGARRSLPCVRLETRHVRRRNPALDQRKELEGRSGLCRSVCELGRLRLHGRAGRRRCAARVSAPARVRRGRSA